MKKIIALLLAAVMVMCLFAGCASSGGSKVIKIGVFEPQSGDNGAGGKQEVLGIQYANSVKPTVTINGEEYKIELDIQDNQSSTDKAVSAAQQLVADKVSVVLGSYGSGVSIAAGTYFANAKIPAIGCSCTNAAVTAGNDYYFRVCFLDPFQGSVMASFAMDEFGAKKAYVLSMLGDDYTVGLAKNFVKAFEEAGGEIVAMRRLSRARRTSPRTSITPSPAAQTSSSRRPPSPMPRRSSSRPLHSASASPSSAATRGRTPRSPMRRTAPTCRSSSPHSLTRTTSPVLLRNSSPAIRRG